MQTTMESPPQRNTANALSKRDVRVGHPPRPRNARILAEATNGSFPTGHSPNVG